MIRGAAREGRDTKAVSVRYLEPVRTNLPKWTIRRITKIACPRCSLPILVTNYSTGGEIEKLRNEAQALKKIKETMGTESFPQLLFDKVYKQDIARLRSMEDMWKTRRPPEPLDYASVMEKAADTRATKQKILKDGQRKWTLEENIIVFKDR